MKRTGDKSPLRIAGTAQDKHRRAVNGLFAELVAAGRVAPGLAESVAALPPSPDLPEPGVYVVPPPPGVRLPPESPEALRHAPR